MKATRVSLRSAGCVALCVLVGGCGALDLFSPEGSPDLGAAARDLSMPDAAMDLALTLDLAGCRSNADCQQLGGGSICCSGTCVIPATDPKNCGGCGNVCAPLPFGVAPGCADGNCIVGEGCIGWDDCNHNPLDSCETNLQHDPFNCGACGNVCKAAANSLPTCTNGRCSAICAPGYADCNLKIDDGCEIDTTFDVGNCGGCGKSCLSPAHATPACDQGKCGFRCDLNWSDCDGNPANGCEVDVRSDGSHCGHCGNVCPPGQSCVASRCQ